MFSISLTDSALHCSQTQPVYVTLCCVTYTTMVYVLQYLHAISVVVIHGIMILCNQLQPTEIVCCKYPLLLWMSWNCTTKIFRPNFFTRISTQVWEVICEKIDPPAVKQTMLNSSTCFCSLFEETKSTHTLSVCTTNGARPICCFPLQVAAPRQRGWQLTCLSVRYSNTITKTCYHSYQPTEFEFIT